MKLFNRIILAFIIGISLYSCSSNNEQFVGSWETEYEEEIIGYNFYPVKEVLTLNENSSFVQAFTYFEDDSYYDTLAIVSVNGEWELANNCLEMVYDTTSVTVNSEDEVFIDELLEQIKGYIKLNNENIQKAHNEDTQYGILNAAVKDGKLISISDSENEEDEVIYTKAK